MSVTINLKDGDVDPQKDYKISIRQWLRENDLPSRWLANQLEKSEGTVRNWLYNGIKITDANKRAIDTAMEQFEKGFSCRDVKSSNNVNFQNIEVIGTIKDIRSIAFWCQAAEVPQNAMHDFSQKFFHDEYKSEFGRQIEDLCALARWITDTLASEAQRVISEMLANGKNPLEADLAKTSFLKVDRPEGLTEELIPFESDRLQCVFIQIAAKYEGYDDINDWIKKCLDQASLKPVENNMQAFLNQVYDDGRQRVAKAQDDDVPF